ncbi:MAG: glucose-1-phosphate thymidylyltransferase [Candidatus Melainabacteria bacterium RIFCSPHIGHO2_02_FULL_34_12]|nr:MAG: glucose-1-phosphate thymidylyltransferase [Candidatus Melainabacteria bacterium RIFCSPHIGHO2_02_FULL_34_12]
MKAVILSGGSGQRLAPLTHTTTKQLLPIANKPTLFHILDLIKEETPIKEVAIVVSEDYGHQVKEKITNSEYNGYFKFDFVFQDKPLGLAHAVQITSMHIGYDPFLMFLGDILIDKGELKKAYEMFVKNKPETLVLVKEIDDPRPYGIAEVEDGKVTKLVEKPQNPKSNLCLSGIYFFQSSIFYAIANIKPSYRGELEITDAIDFQISLNKIVEPYVIKSWWFDIGTPENMLKGNEVILNNLPASVNSKLDSSVKITGKVVIEQHVIIEDSEITGPVIIARNSYIKGCKIGPYVSLGENVYLQNTKIENSIIRENTKIKDFSGTISDSVIGRNAEFSFGTNGKSKTKLVIGDETKCILL